MTVHNTINIPDIFGMCGVITSSSGTYSTPTHINIQLERRILSTFLMMIFKIENDKIKLKHPEMEFTKIKMMVDSADREMRALAKTFYAEQGSPTAVSIIEYINTAPDETLMSIVDQWTRANIKLGDLI